MKEHHSMKELIAARINSAGLQLPVFNPAALELQQLMGNAEVGTKQLEATITKDPALVVQVLRLANASRFAGLSKIATIEQALLRLGTRQVCQLSVAAAQFSLYKSRHKLLQGHLSASWNRAYACAIGADWVASRIGRVELAQSAFLAGLLHDVGNLLILMVIEDVALKGDAGGQFSAPLVNDIMASFHCESGYMLMQRWNLPEAYCIAARDHHLEDADTRNSLLLLVRLMDQVCQRMGIGGDGDASVLPAASSEAQALCVSEITLAELEVFLEESMGLETA